MSDPAFIDQIMAVMEAAFDPAWGEAWNRRQLTDALMLPNTFAVLISESGEELTDYSSQVAAGFVLSRNAPGEEELLLIAVRPEFRRRGLAEKLVDALKAQAGARGAEKIFLEMRQNNPAQTLYRKLGFQPIGRRQDYYLFADGSRMDAITFCLLNKNV
jgi:ribosomal-protein-alanine N-acetyltransferase